MNLYLNVPKGRSNLTLDQQSVLASRSPESQLIEGDDLTASL